MPGTPSSPLLDALAYDLVGHLGVAPGGVHARLPQALRYPA